MKDEKNSFIFCNDNNCSLWSFIHIFKLQSKLQYIKKANLEFENYLNVEVSGTDLVTVMNRAIDSNEKNEVEKNNKGIYKDNEKNSISIEVKITDNDTIYQMETFDKSGMQKFLANYGSIKFKCTSIEYHQSTKKVKHMLFEQISN